MPTPTIPDGELFFNATLYTGNGAVRSITNGATGQSFQPDFVWIKNRTSGVFWHQLYDVNRGPLKAVFSNDTSSESTYTDTLTAFTSTGFNLGTDATFNGGVNKPSDAYVAWQWKAGGAAVTNTAGTISSQVSANTTSGFSVVTWVHSSTTSTIGHGLGVAPQFIILKSRTTAYNWDVGCNSIGWANRLILNSTGTTTSGFWNSTSPTSTVFTYAGSGATNGDNMVAYCFTPIAGYSAFGSYTGNGSTDGPFVYLGFRPRFIMLKLSSGSGNWFIRDTSRDPTNSTLRSLYPNLSDAEATTANGLDILSNGFKVRNSSAGFNGSGETMIYAAFAENPFKYANAR